jgi:predicted nucleic acid-binding protein
MWTILPMLAPIDVSARFTQWQQDATPLYAPMFWVAETVSAIRGGVYSRVITPEEGDEAIDHLFALEVEALPMTQPLCRSALQWARRLGQGKAYDSFYLALADELGVEFWTADRRLANGARQAGASWAHWIGETEDGR